MATHRKPHTTPQPPVSHVPPPWKCKAETYWLLFHLRNPLPTGLYDPLETSHPACSTDSFAGSLGMIHIVRYTDTPVGSYDELAIIPGVFRIPGGSEKEKKRMRVSRIYVSQRETCWNGRKNWNMPKHLARFSFSSPPVAPGSSPPTSLQVSVYPPAEAEGSDPEKPFFSATLTPWRFPPPLPLSTAWLPLSSVLVQPPIPASEDDVLLCGEERWKSFGMLAHSRRARLMSVKMGEEGQEAWWPDVKPWSFGVWLEDATIEIYEPEEFDA